MTSSRMSKRLATDRFILDTNVLFSAVLSANSVSGLALFAALERGVVLVSEATVEEVADVLSRPKFDPYVTAEETGPPEIRWQPDAHPKPDDLQRRTPQVGRRLRRLVSGPARLLVRRAERG